MEGQPLALGPQLRPRPRVPGMSGVPASYTGGPKVGPSREQLVAIMQALQARRQIRLPLDPFRAIRPDPTWDLTNGLLEVGNRRIDRWGRDVTSNPAASLYAPGIEPRAPGNAVGRADVTGRRLALERLAAGDRAVRQIDTTRRDLAAQAAKPKAPTRKGTRPR